MLLVLVLGFVETQSPGTDVPVPQMRMSTHETWRDALFPRRLPTSPPFQGFSPDKLLRRTLHDDRKTDGLRDCAFVDENDGTIGDSWAEAIPVFLSSETSPCDPTSLTHIIECSIMPQLRMIVRQGGQCQTVME